MHVYGGIPWRSVHEVMIRAALAAPNIVPDPPPFVLQVVPKS